jgi:predicted PurR-regulated permease PerM
MNSGPISTSRKVYVQVFFFLAFGFFLFQMFVLLKPFLPAFFVSALLAMAFQPLAVRVKRKVRNSSFSALIMTVGIFLLTVVPLIFVGMTLFSEADRLIPTVKKLSEFFKAGDVSAILSHLPSFLKAPAEKFSSHLFNYFEYADISLKTILLDKIQQIGTAIVAAGGHIAKNLVVTLVFGLVMFLTLFFAFRDGEMLANKVLALIPMADEHKNTVAKKAYETFRAVAVGVFVTATVQGLIAMFGFWVAGVNLPALLGLLTLMVSLVGASLLVTLPVAIAVFLSGAKGAGIFLLIWGALVVGLLDNFLRPYLIGSRAKMPFFLMVFSIVAGIKAYGFLGIVLGPVLVGTVITFIRIYRQEYGTQVKPSDKAN